MQEKRDVLVIEATKPYITNDLKPKENLRVCACRVSTNQLDQINSYNALIEEYSKRIKETLIGSLLVFIVMKELVVLLIKTVKVLIKC